LLLFSLFAAFLRCTSGKKLSVRLLMSRTSSSSCGFSNTVNRRVLISMCLASGPTKLQGKTKTTDQVFRLDHNSKDKRGNAGNQGYLWPPMWRKSPENPNPPSISLLELRSVQTTSRAIILNFGTLHFQVRLLNVILWICAILILL